VSVEELPGGGQWKIQDREITLISLPLLYQWQVRGHTGHTPSPRAHLKLNEETANTL